MTVERLDQTYERMSESTYRYQSGKGSFILDTNPVGFVTQYPGQWELKKNRLAAGRVIAGSALDAWNRPEVLVHGFHPPLCAMSI